MSVIISEFLQSQLGFPFDLQKVKLDDEKPLLIQLDEAFSHIQKEYLQDEKQISSVWKRGQFLLKIAPLYDYDNKTNANGYWSFAKLVIKFGKILQINASKNVYNREQVVNVLQVSFLMTTFYFIFTNNTPFNTNF